MQSDKILFSIITVVYNDGDGLAKTADSVLKQSFSNFEYIIIDGSSTDNTPSIAQDVIKKFKAEHKQISYISEPDKGIYDAMNKGTKLSHGKWLLFLNAGDLFYNRQVLKKTASYDNDKYSALYGSTNLQAYDLHRIVEPQDISNLTKHMIFCHQSVFVSRQVMMEYNYNINYKFVADFDFFLRCYLDGKKFQKIPFVISTFKIGGASSSGNFEMFYEELNVRKNNNVISEQEYQKEFNDLKKKEKSHKIFKAFKERAPKLFVERFDKKRFIKDGYTSDEA